MPDIKENPPYYLYGQEESSTLATQEMLTNIIKNPQPLSQSKELTELINWAILNRSTNKVYRENIKKLFTMLDSLSASRSEEMKAMKEAIDSYSEVEPLDDVLKKLEIYPHLVNAIDGLKMTPLISALEDGSIDAAIQLLAKGADVNVRNKKSGETPLIVAAKLGSLELVQELIAKKAVTNDVDQMNHTAFYYAASKGYIEIVELLIANGADEYLTNPEFLEMVEKIKETQAQRLMDRLITELKAGVSSISTNKIELFEKLNSSQLISLYFKLKSENQPIAAEALKLEIIKMIETTDNPGINELISATRLGMVPLIEHLKKRGVDVNAQDIEGKTALMYVGDGDFANKLLEEGARIDIRDNKNRTVLEWATTNNPDVAHKINEIIINAEQKALEFNQFLRSQIMDDMNFELQIDNSNHPFSLVLIINTDNPTKTSLKVMVDTLNHLGILHSVEEGADASEKIYRYRSQDISNFMQDKNYKEKISSIFSAEKKQRLLKLRKEKSRLESLQGTAEGLLKICVAIKAIEAEQTIHEIVSALKSNNSSIREMEDLAKLDSSQMMDLYFKLKSENYFDAAKQLKEMMYERYQLSLIELKDCCQYVYENHLSQPLTDKSVNADWVLETPRGTIQRPNHGLAHTMRTAMMIPIVAEYLQKSSFKNHEYQFSEDKLKKLQIVELFFVAGRENEVSGGQDKALFKKFKQYSKIAFEKYVRSMQPPIMDEVEIAYYKSFFDSDPNNADSILLNCVHDLDVARCLDSSKYLNVVRKYEKYIEPFKLQQLVEYAQGLILATGDRNLTMPGQTYNGDVFYQSSTNVDYCFQKMCQVALPHESKLKSQFQWGLSEEFTLKLGSSEIHKVDLTPGPLPKNIYTKKLERIIKHLLKNPQQEINYDAYNNLTLEFDQFTYNLTEIIKHANLSHLEFSTEDFVHFQQKIERERISNFTTNFYGNIVDETKRFDRKRFANEYPDSSLNNLIEGEIYAINIYTGKAYTYINSLLRTGTLPLEEKGNVTLSLLTAAIAGSALQKVAETKMRPTYRCVGHSVFEEGKPALAKKVAIESNPAFYSASADRPALSFFEQGRYFVFSEVRGAYVAPISQHPLENEVLLPPTQFQWSDFESDSKGNLFFINRPVATLEGLTAEQLTYSHHSGFSDQYGNTALMYAILHQPPLINHNLLSQSIAFLLNENVDVNAQNMHGRTALHYATTQENKEIIIEALLERGAKLLQRDNVGISPLDILSGMALSENLCEKIQIQINKENPNALQDMVAELEEAKNEILDELEVHLLVFEKSGGYNQEEKNEIEKLLVQANTFCKKLNKEYLATSVILGDFSQIEALASSLALELVDYTSRFRHPPSEKSGRRKSLIFSREELEKKEPAQLNAEDQKKLDYMKKPKGGKS